MKMISETFCRFWNNLVHEMKLLCRQQGFPQLKILFCFNFTKDNTIFGIMKLLHWKTFSTMHLIATNNLVS